LLIDEGARRISSNVALQPYIARSFQHAAIKEAANKVMAQSQSTSPWPGPLFTTPVEAELISVCNAFVDLQSLRHKADYNTALSFERAEGIAAVSRAQAAHQDWAGVRASTNASIFLLLSAKLLPDR
jgi:hypothetical protein